MGSPPPQEEVLSECLQRQLTELEALQSMYSGDGEFVMAEPEAEALLLLRELQESSSADSCLVESLRDTALPEISFTINLLEILFGGQPLSIHFRLPHQYPQLEAPHLRVDCSGLVTKGQHQQITGALQKLAAKLTSQESVLDILQKAQELVADLNDDARQDVASSTAPDLEKPSKAVIVRRVLWFHHLKALSKRKAICDWSKELRLGGFCKPGFPGVLIFEGLVEDADEYQQRLQSLRWQALQQRGEERDEGEEPESLRRFPVGITELPEGGMSELASHCRRASAGTAYQSGYNVWKEIGTSLGPAPWTIPLR